MFTGIIERRLPVIRAIDHGASRKLILPNPWDDVQAGESIAINGVCLTVAQIAGAQLTFDVIKETLDRTNLGQLGPCDEVNVERSLRVGDRIDGHFVQGHVDDVGKLVKKIADQTEWRYTIQAPAEIAKILVPKGSICVDGVSLTIASVQDDQFDIALIPTTLSITTLGKRDAGWMFNLEADILSKQVVHFLESRAILSQKSK